MFSFSTKFHIGKERKILIDETKFSIEIDSNITYHIFGDKQSIKDSSVITITCKDFAGIEMTIENARILYWRLLWYAYSTNTPIEFLIASSNKDEVGFLKYFDIYDNFNSRLSMSVTASIGYADEIALLNENFRQIDSNRTDKEFFSVLEIYNLSRTSNCLENRFLLLVICLESFIPEEKKNSTYEDKVSDLVKYIEKIPNFEGKGDLVLRIKELKRNWIKRSIIDFIKKQIPDNKYMDLSVVDFFSEVYCSRSHFTHSGKLEFFGKLKYKSIRDIIDSLHCLVKDIIKKTIE